jgi:K+-sensing histidine kinase KdpD
VLVSCFPPRNVSQYAFQRIDIGSNLAENACLLTWQPQARHVAALPSKQSQVAVCRVTFGSETIELKFLTVKGKNQLRALFGYAVALIAVGGAVVATLELGSAMKHTPTLFFCSVALSSRLGGVWPGIFGGLLSAISLDYYFIPPLYALGISLEEAPIW